MVKGDPTGTVKYQSRKRWATRRGSSDIIPTQMVTSAIAELAEEDEDLEALLTP